MQHIYWAWEETQRLTCNGKHTTPAHVILDKKNLYHRISKQTNMNPEAKKHYNMSIITYNQNLYQDGNWYEKN